MLPEGKLGMELYDLSKDQAETNNIAEAHPDKVAELKKQINLIIARGRTTEGPIQPNDTDWWKGLNWITKAQYDKLTQTP